MSSGRSSNLRTCPNYHPQLNVAAATSPAYIGRMIVPFVKMHGCGNDFIIIDERSVHFDLTPAQVSALSDRRTGIGCDQLITLEPSAEADVFMRIRNPDGSEAGACGNGTRCVADILMRQDGADRALIRTVSGDLDALRLSNGLIQVDMGEPRCGWDQIPLRSPADTRILDLPGRPAAISMGNPHVTFFVEDLAQTAITDLGPRFEHDAMFPDRANVGFAQILDRETIRLRVWERGAGLTLACGSGACATLVNASRRGLTDRTARVLLDGGELVIAWREDGHVLMTGPVATAFTGQAVLQ